MNILVINENKYIINEMKEFVRNNNSKLFYADSTEYAIKLLAKFRMDKVIIDLNSISTAGLIKYINENYIKAKVFLTIEHNLKDAISVFKNGNYEVIGDPMKLHELKKIMEN